MEREKIIDNSNHKIIDNNRIIIDDGNRMFTEETKRIIYCNANGLCQNPGCGIQLKYKGGFAEFAHIYGREPGSARYQRAKNAKMVSSCKNGLLLCCNCHTIIDKCPKEFPIKVLKKWQLSVNKPIAITNLFTATAYSVIKVEASVNMYVNKHKHVKASAKINQ